MAKAELERRERRAGGMKLLSQPALEIVAALLITLSAATSTWSAYQAARWSGVQARSFAEAGTRRAAAIQNTSVATARVTIDVGLFAQWLAAETEDDRTLTAALEARFPRTLAVAFAAWRAAGRPDSAAAPASPFELPEYRLPETTAAEDLNREGDARFQAALDANQQSDDYVLMTVVLAALIVVSALGREFPSLGIRRGAVVLGTTGLLACWTVLATFPVH
jgi:hypothetical protein